jgi:hypothetical protein
MDISYMAMVIDFMDRVGFDLLAFGVRKRFIRV